MVPLQTGEMKPPMRTTRDKSAVLLSSDDLVVATGELAKSQDHRRDAVR
jgi:hypothetical protein